MQVVTSENFQQLVETGKVDEFKAPADAIAKAADAAVTVDTKDQPRGEDGKFVAKDAEVKADDEVKDFDEDLRDPKIPMPEKVRRQISRKHVEVKKAEGLAEILRAERQAERERADRAEAALRALQDGKSEAAATPKDSKEPKAEDFKTVGDYAEALAEYKVEKKFAEREAKAQQEQRERAAVAAQTELNGAIEKVMKDTPDYLDVINASDIDTPEHITVYLATSGETGVRLGYYFAKPENRAEYSRIAKLPPVRALAEIGKLETRLERKAEPAPDKDATATPSTSRAPAPITPIDASAKAVVQKDPSKMSLQELREYDRQQRLAKAR